MKIAFFIPTLKGGGAERVIISIANGLSENGYEVDLVVVDGKGEYKSEIGQDVRVVDLEAGRVIKAIPGLIKYLKTRGPELMLSTIWHANISAVIASKLAFAGTKIIIRESNFLTNSKKALGRLSFLMTGLIRLFYPLANKIVAPSKGIADDLINAYGIKQDRIVVIRNPSIERWMIEKAREPLDHPWLIERNQPVFLTMGSLSLQKDFLTLLKAFKRVNRNTPSRLIILGEGKQRQDLEAFIRQLGIEDRVDLPGFINNPFSYMVRADAYVLSSRWEGLPNGLIQALGLGMKVVSTDCQSGPREILRDGKRGMLVPVGDEKSLAEAMVEALKGGASPDVIDQVVAEYSLDSVLPLYSRIIEEIGCPK